MRNFFIRLLLRLLGYNAPIHERINQEAMQMWLKSLNVEAGFKDYFKYRDLQILKTIANGLSEKEYWLYCGMRSELLQLAGKAKEIMDKEEREEKKKRVWPLKNYWPI